MKIPTYKDLDEAIVAAFEFYSWAVYSPISERQSKDELGEESIDKFVTNDETVTLTPDDLAKISKSRIHDGLGIHEDSHEEFSSAVIDLEKTWLEVMRYPIPVPYWKTVQKLKEHWNEPIGNGPVYQLVQAELKSLERKLRKSVSITQRSHGRPVLGFVSSKTVERIDTPDSMCVDLTPDQVKIVREIFENEPISTEEICQSLGKSPETVRSQLRIAKRKLRAIWVQIESENRTYSVCHDIGAATSLN